MELWNFAVRRRRRSLRPPRVERTPRIPGQTCSTDPGGTDSGTPANAATVEALAAALVNLSPADRARLAAMLWGNSQDTAKRKRERDDTRRPCPASPGRGRAVGSWTPRMQ